MTKTTSNKKTSTIKNAAEKTFEAAQENVQKAIKEATSNFDDATEFGKANYEALVASGNAAVKVAQSVNSDFVASSKKAVEQNVADVKTLFAAKSPVEFFELQANILKGRFDEFVAETTRFNELATSSTNEVIEPLKSRYEAVAAKMNLPLAG